MEPITAMSKVYRCTVDEMKVRLKKQYDGYHFSDRLTDIYNPFSILNAFAQERIADYWFRSGTPTYLIRLLNHSQENLNELTGKYYDPSQFIDYKAKDGWIASLKHLTTSMSLNSNWTVLQMKLSNRLKIKAIPVHMQPTPVHYIK